MMCLWSSYKKKYYKNFFGILKIKKRKESDPKLDPDPHQNVTDPQHRSES